MDLFFDAVCEIPSNFRTCQNENWKDSAHRGGLNLKIAAVATMVFSAAFAISGALPVIGFVGLILGYEGVQIGHRWEHGGTVLAGTKFGSRVFEGATGVNTEKARMKIKVSYLLDTTLIAKHIWRQYLKYT